jgi:hypothetical protein
MVRCYDCGQKVADAELVRRDILVGGRYLQLGGLRFGSPRRGYVRRVNLCPACAEKRTGSSFRALLRLDTALSGLDTGLPWFVLGLVGVLVLGAGMLLFFWVVLGASAIINNPGRPVPVSPGAKGGTAPQPTPISVPATGVIRIPADDLLTQFRANEDAADRRFRDRTVEVTGKPVHVYETKTGEPVVTFGEIAIFRPKVECYFRGGPDPHVGVGEPCTIQGRCMGKAGVHAGTWLKDCHVVPEEK